MINSRRYGWVLSFLLTLTLVSCNLPTGQTASTPDIEGTVAAQVAIAQAAQTMVAQTMGANTANPPVETATNTLQAAPVNTDTPTPTPTITQTPTPEGVFLVLSQDTYCREGGPYSAFKIVVTIKAGVTVEVISQNPEKDSYFVKNPYQANSSCWVWGKYATLTGNTAALTVSTMQPTPTPTFTPTPSLAYTLSYVGIENCGLQYAFKLFIKNTGGVTWQYILISGTDTVTAYAINHSSNIFKEYSGCSTTLTQGDLTPGEESYVLNVDPGQFAYNPSGHLINITVKLCSEDNGLGQCLAKDLSFTP